MGAFAGPKRITENLVLYLDAGNATSYPGTGTSWTDLSGTVTSTTLTNHVFLSSNKGTFFLGSPSNSYMTTGTVPAFTEYGSPLSANVFTIEVMIKPTNLQQSFYVTPSGVGIDRFLRLGSDGRFGITLTQIADVGLRTFQSTDTLAIGKFAYITYVVNGTSIRLYQNGVLESDQTDVSGLSSANWGNVTWTIGQRSNSTNWFMGEIASIAAYDAALTDEQVKENFNAIRGRYGL